MTNFIEPDNLVKYDALAIGTPTYYHNVPDQMKTIFEHIVQRNMSLKGKIGTAFGSYGWSGEAPGFVLEIMQNKFGMNIFDPPLLARYKPDSIVLERCKSLGRELAEKLIL